MSKIGNMPNGKESTEKGLISYVRKINKKSSIYNCGYNY